LAKDESVVARLAQIGARVALSFDSFEKEADFLLQGANLVELKLRCLDLLEKYDVDTTLIPVMTKGVNEHEVGKFIQLSLDRPNIRHIELHTMTYTGQSGGEFDRSGRITMDEVLDAITEHTDGLLRYDDFVPSSCAHPLCYQIAYLLMDPGGGPPVPFLRFMSPEEMYACLGDHLYLEPSPTLEKVFLDAIDRLWIEDDDASARILGVLSRLVRRMFPVGQALTRAESLSISERAIKAVYVHTHMDEENFDVERVARCCDSNCYADGTTIPVCSYNVLYREKEDRFMDTPAQWGARHGAQLPQLPQLIRIEEPNTHV
jgi:uncharacterized radical SAM superfamily Fe-S cluster-containing enzyme